MLSREALLQHVERLGREFVRRGMRAHAQKLRLYYLALQKGLASPRHEVDVHWNEPFVLEWLRTLQLPPYADAYPVLPRGASCPRCQQRGAQPSTRTECVFEGGVRMRCGTCEAVWLEAEGPAPARPAPARPGP
jgi:hypothetical protein